MNVSNERESIFLYVAVGGTGQLGSATAHVLLKRGEFVTIVTRNATHGADLRKAGARIAVADFRDISGLREVFRTGTHALLLNPPPDPSSDTDAEERASVRCRPMIRPAGSGGLPAGHHAPPILLRARLCVPEPGPAPGRAWVCRR